MSGYLSSRKLGNVKGRIRYMTDEKKQEKAVISFTGRFYSSCKNS